MRTCLAGAIAAVLGARAAAAAPAPSQPSTMPVLGWSIALPPGWSISAGTLEYGSRARNDLLSLAGTVATTIEVSRASGSCADAYAMMPVVLDSGAGIVVVRSNAPDDWYPIEEQRALDASEQSRGVRVHRIDCRDLGEQGALTVVVESDLEHGEQLDAAVQAIEHAAAATSNVLPEYDRTGDQLLAGIYAEADRLRKERGRAPVAHNLGVYETYNPSDEARAQRDGTAPPIAPDPPPAPSPAPGPSDAGTGTVRVDDAAKPYEEPASLDVIRLAIAGGQESADGADSRAFAGLRVTMVPQHILSDYENRGYVTGFDVAAGGAGSAFVGDISWVNGYGLSSESGFALSGLVVVGYDRVGGGFDPVDGAYIGLGGYARLGLGSFALEGAATTTWSTGTDELRARAAIVTHVGARVLALGGFYERWDAVGTLVGASIGLSP